MRGGCEASCVCASACAPVWRPDVAARCAERMLHLPHSSVLRTRLAMPHSCPELFLYHVPRTRI